MAVLAGNCFCGAVKFEMKDDTILLSAYCHCTNCQLLTGGVAVHTVHIPEAAFQFTGSVETFSFVSKSQKHRKRCAACGTQFASFNSDKKTWSVWSSAIQKQEGRIPESIRPTAHMFYGSRILDVQDDLGKWEGYEGKSNRIA